MLDEATSILQMLHQGGSLAVTALAIAAWWYERKAAEQERAANRELQHRLFELSTAQIQSNLKHEAALDALRSVLGSLAARD